MPELPDLTIYLEKLDERIQGAMLEKVNILNPFLLRTAIPPIASVEGRRVNQLRRIGKRIVVGFEGGLFLVVHLMIAGRLRWLQGKEKPPGRITLATFLFATGTLVLTEAGTKRRASVHLVDGEAALAKLDPGGLEVLMHGADAFSARLRLENHTLKRALTDPHLFAGIGNAYSDEILHRAKLSPIALTERLTDEEVLCLYEAVRTVMTEWVDRLRIEAGNNFPMNVTAFRTEMAVHGRFGKPCPVCGAPVQRIVYAENESNYCARCQTGGRLLADRALSRLLHKSWPKHLDDMEG
jgi:formamidopyrimidine-DNA glycosylase